MLCFSVRRFFPSLARRKLLLHRRCFSQMVRDDLRNVAIVAHVDHGKTTLMDALLRQCGALTGSFESDTERVMDSNSIEKERGITILSKCTALSYGSRTLNCIDTPGHADFGGEVERIMSMVDGLLLVIDINEGPMPQTNFILSKAHAAGIAPLIYFNKVDRLDYETLVGQRLDDAMMETMEALDSAGYGSQQIDDCFEHILFGSAKGGFSTRRIEDVQDLEDISQNGSMKPLLDSIVERISGPLVEEYVDDKATGKKKAAPFKMLAALIDSDAFFGRFLIGRVASGRVAVGQQIQALCSEGSQREKFQVSRLFAREGMRKVAVDSARAGDIIGIPNDGATRIFDTVCDLQCAQPLSASAIDRPTLSIRLVANNGPLRGNEGSVVLISDIGKRLEKEASVNVSVEVLKLSESVYEIRGRGELSLAVVLENMRREDMEFCIAAPKVMFKRGFVDANGNEVKSPTANGSLKNGGEVKSPTVNGSTKNGGKVSDSNLEVDLEPYESVTVLIPGDLVGDVMEYLDTHGGVLQEFNPEFSKTDSKLVYDIPSRGLLGYERLFKTESRGLGRIYRQFSRYGALRDDIQRKTRTCLVSVGSGKATFDAMSKLEARAKGPMYVRPNDAIYEGMIIGESNRHVDIVCNPCRSKEVSNVRTARADEHIVLKAARELLLEDVLCELQSDELCEVTPKSIRMRKVELKEKTRLSAKRKGIELSA